MKTINETLPAPKTAAQRIARQANAWLEELESKRFTIRTNIPIKTYSESRPITVQSLIDGELDFCNHAGNYLDLVHSDASDTSTMVSATVCDKENCLVVMNDLGEWND